MDTLSRIFGGRTRVKIIRLFLLNPGRVYHSEDVSRAVGASAKETDRELDSLRLAGLLVKKESARETKKRKKIFSLKFKGFTLNKDFIYLRPLEGLLVNSTLIKNQELLKKLITIGNVELAVVAGVFVQDMEARVDLLIVGNKINKSTFGRVIKYLESNIGRELKYSLLDINDFTYRFSIGDRLLRDVFDFKHQILLDKIGIKTGSQSK